MKYIIRSLIVSQFLFCFSINVSGQDLVTKRIENPQATLRGKLYPRTGGYACIGVTTVTAENSLRATMLKLNNNYEVQQQRTFKPSIIFNSSYSDELVSGVVADSEGFLLGGGMSTSPPNPAVHTWLTRTDTSFNTLWSVRFDNSLPYGVLAGVFTNAGQFTAYYGGINPTDRLLKLQGSLSSPNFTPSKIVCDPYETFQIKAAAEAGTSGVHYLGGVCQPWSEDEAGLIMKINPSGIEWARGISLSAHEFEVTKIIPSSDGNIFVALFDKSPFQGPGFIAKFSPSGQVIWCKRFSFGSNKTEPRAILETSQGEIFVACSDYSDPRPLLMKFSASGDLIWAKSHHLGFLLFIDQLLEIRPGRFAFVLPGGGTRIVEFDADGNGCEMQAESMVAVISAPLSLVDFGLTVEPETVSTIQQPLTAMNTTFQTAAMCAVSNSAEEMKRQSLQLYPQPAGSFVRLELPDGFNAQQNARIKLYTLQGQLVRECAFTPVLQLNDLASGSYLIEISDRISNIRELLLKAE